MTEITEAKPASWRRSPRLRWAVPAVAAVAVAAAFAVPALAAAGDADLPDRTPEELLAAVVQAEPSPLTGTIVYTARLGLPDLPLTDMADAGPANLLSGSTTARVWWDGAGRSRLALLGATSEFSVVQDGLETWTYSSAENQVVHYTVDGAGAAALEGLMGDEATATPVPGQIADPQQLARAVLLVAQQSSNVTMDADTTVAGRSAYQLVVTPKTHETLVSHVVLAVDAETSMPLRLQVWSTTNADAPALEVGYTDVSFGAPDPAVLDFSVPVGATVRDVQVPVPDLAELAGSGLPGLEGLSGLEGLAGGDGLTGLADLRDMTPEQLAAVTGVDPAELQRIAGLEGPERLAALQDLLAQVQGHLAEADPSVDPDADPDAAAAPGEGEGMQILGTGWGTVLELSGVDPAELLGTGAEPTAETDADAPADPDATPGTASGEELFAELDSSMAGMHEAAGALDDLISRMATQVPEGTLYTSALLSVLVTDDGRVLLGPVPGDTLRQLA